MPLTRLERHELRIDLTPGVLWDYFEIDQRGNRVCLGRYAMLGLAEHAHTHQQLVCYRGVGGRDDGRVYCCPQMDFALKFVRVPVEAAVPQGEALEVPAGEGLTVAMSANDNGK